MPPENDLSVGEELQFHYLLGLLPPLCNQPDFQWLPQLFSIIGHERLLLLCKYAGGETIRIPTLAELQKSMEGLEYFYNKHIKHQDVDVPEDLVPIVDEILKVYDARNNQDVYSVN